MSNFKILFVLFPNTIFLLKDHKIFFTKIYYQIRWSIGHTDWSIWAGGLQLVECATLLVWPLPTSTLQPRSFKSWFLFPFWPHLEKHLRLNHLTQTKGHHNQFCLWRNHAFGWQIAQGQKSSFWFIWNYTVIWMVSLEYIYHCLN